METHVLFHEKKVPIIGLAGFSGTGKTTLLEKVIPIIRAKGVTVAVIKHDAHGLSFDNEGKDSKRFADAGAMYSIVSSGENAAMFIQKPLDISDALKLVPSDTDLIIVEGYKYADIPQIGLCREATKKGFTSDITRFKALVTDLEVPEAKVPVFSFDDYDGIAEFIMKGLQD